MPNEKLNIQTVKLASIVPYWRNPRKNDAAVASVKESITRYGYNVPILVDKKMVIIAGHTRYQALKQLDWESADVVITDMPAKKAKQFRIVDNKTSEHAEWDMDKLLAELREIPGTDDLQPFFQDFSIEAFLNSATNGHADPLTDAEIAARGAENRKEIGRFGQTKEGLVEIICPHCTESFMLDKAEIARRSQTKYVAKPRKKKEKA